MSMHTPYPDDPSEEELAAMPSFRLDEHLNLPEMLDRDFAHVVYTELRKGNSVCILRTPVGFEPTAAQFSEINATLLGQLNSKVPPLLDKYVAARLEKMLPYMVEELQDHLEKAQEARVDYHFSRHRLLRWLLFAGSVAALSWALHLA